MLLFWFACTELLLLQHTVASLLHASCEFFAFINFSIFMIHDICLTCCSDKTKFFFLIARLIGMVLFRLKIIVG
jgi:hypothetical protein